MIRVEVRKIPKEIVMIDEYEVDDVRKFEFVAVKLFDFTLNR